MTHRLRKVAKSLKHRTMFSPNAGWQRTIVALVVVIATGVAAQWPDSASTVTDVRVRKALVFAGSAALISGAWVGLDQAWYAQYERGSFHGFNDGAEWRGMDKLGHAFSAYTTAEWGHGMFRWAGAKPGTARWVGGSLGWLFLAGVEVLDGYSEGWGFSGWDLVANTSGTLLFIGQDALWGEQRARLKFSAHLSGYAHLRPDLLGEGLAERILKDYNGQTLWLSLSPRLAGWQPDRQRWYACLNLAIGYGAQGMTTALADATAPCDRRSSRVLLSPDIDLRRIQTRKKWLRTTLDVLNCVKFPMPAVEFRDGGIRAHAVYF